MPSLLDGAGRSLAVVADKAYGSRLIRQRIAEQGALAVIPSKSNARKPIPHDANLYRRRNIVERFFCTMKDMRRLANRKACAPLDRDTTTTDRTSVDKNLAPMSRLRSNYQSALL